MMPGYAGMTNYDTWLCRDAPGYAGMTDYDYAGRTNYDA